MYPYLYFTCAISIPHKIEYSLVNYLENNEYLNNWILILKCAQPLLGLQFSPSADLLKSFSFHKSYFSPTRLNQLVHHNYLDNASNALGRIFEYLQKGNFIFACEMQPHRLFEH